MKFGIDCPSLISDMM